MKYILTEEEYADIGLRVAEKESDIIGLKQKIEKLQERLTAFKAPNRVTLTKGSSIDDPLGEEVLRVEYKVKDMDDATIAWFISMAKEHKRI